MKDIKDVHRMTGKEIARMTEEELEVNLNKRGEP
jgi:hypothetical protein